MKLLLILLPLLILVGCQGLEPKGIGLDIEFVKSPTHKEAKAWRQSQRWERAIVKLPSGAQKAGWSNKHQVLINGEPVDKAKYPFVIRILSEKGAGCTASVVGPQAILTAAHCAETGEKVSFTTVDGKKFVAVMTHFEGYPQTDLDLNIGKTNAVMSVPPVTIRTDRFEKKDMLVDLIGYGCTQPGGTGGNDGVLRKGQAKVEKGNLFDLGLIGDTASGLSALCYGDSGGPVFFEGKQIGVNSKGNIENYSWTTRTTLPDAKAWLEKTAASLGLQICGINSQCDGSTPPPITPPGPKQFVFENDVVKIQGVIK